MHFGFQRGKLNDESRVSGSVLSLMLAVGISNEFCKKKENILILDYFINCCHYTIDDIRIRKSFFQAVSLSCVLFSVSDIQQSEYLIFKIQI